MQSPGASRFCLTAVFLASAAAFAPPAAWSSFRTTPGDSAPSTPNPAKCCGSRYSIPRPAAFPVTYTVDGVQYVAIAAGGGVTYRMLTPELRQRGGGNMLFVFRLP